jgi:hypothetical protein
MALLTDDCDIKMNYLRTFTGGNGDYYISVIRNDESGIMHEDCVRIAMSGGFAKTRVKLAVVELFRAMEEQGLNDYPDETFNSERLSNSL